MKKMIKCGCFAVYLLGLILVSSKGTVNAAGRSFISYGYTYEQWEEIYNSYSKPEFYNNLSGKSVYYSGGSIGQISMLKEQGQGFFGYCIEDLDRDEELELLGIGSWYQGNSTGVVSIEAWIYDDIGGTQRSTKVFSKEYAGRDETVIPTEEIMVTVSFQQSEDHAPFILFYTEGLRNQCEDRYYEFNAVCYQGIAGEIQEVASATSVYHETEWEQIASDAEEVMAAQGIESLVEADGEIICRMVMNNKYSENELISGYVEYIEGEGSDISENPSEKNLDTVVGLESDYCVSGNFSGTESAKLEEEFAFYSYPGMYSDNDYCEIWYSRNGQPEQLFKWSEPMWCYLRDPIFTYVSEDGKTYFIVNTSRRVAASYSECMIFGADSSGSFSIIFDREGWAEKTEDGQLKITLDNLEMVGGSNQYSQTVFGASIINGEIVQTDTSDAVASQDGL